MLKLLGRRLLMSAALILIVPAITFVLEALTPGNAADTQLGLTATPEQRQQAIHSLGLDQPLWERYFVWLGHFFQGDLGTSLFTGQSVSHELDLRLFVSLSLIIGATLVMTIIGVLMGVLSARRSGFLGRAVDATSVLGIAVPNFWLGVILIEWFAVDLRLLPAAGYVAPTASSTKWFAGLVLPVITLAFAGITAVAKQTRDQLLTVLDSSFIRNLRANGVSEWSLVFRHSLRNAAIPVVTIVSVLFVGALNGSAVVETIFGLPGLGSAAVEAASSHDIPVIQGVSIYFTVMIIIVNLLADLSYGWLNPRVSSL